MREKNKRNIIVEIKKPLYQNFAYIRDKYLYEAIERGVNVEIRIPQGTAVVDPKKWIKTGKRMEKVFLLPDNPMILWGNRVPIKTEEDKKKDSQAILLEALK